MTNELQILAARANISPAQAVALPAAITKMAQIVGMHERAFIAEATYRNAELRAYIASICAEVTA